MKAPITELIAGYSDAFKIISQAAMGLKKLDEEKKAMELLDRVVQSRDYDNVLEILADYVTQIN